MSFFLGVVLTVATIYVVNYFRENRRANRHVLGKRKNKFYDGGGGPIGEQG